MLVTLYKIGEVYFRLFGTNAFHSKAENERFSAAGSCCRKNLKRENYPSSFGRLRQKFNCTKKRAARAARFFFFFFHSTNKIIDLSRCRYRSRPRFMNSLLLFHLDVQAHVSSETSALGET